MAMRFRKSKKVAPGTKINIGKKSAGVSFGNRGGGVSFNSKTGASVRASIPGTGLYFTGKLFGSKRNRKKQGPKSTAKSLGGIGGTVASLVVFGFACWAVPILIPVFILAVALILFLAYRSVKREQAVDDAADPAVVDDPAPGEMSAVVECPGCSAHFTIQYKPVAAPNGSIKFQCPKCKTVSMIDVSGAS